MDPSRSNAARTPSRLAGSERGGARSCRRTRKRRADAAETLIDGVIGPSVGRVVGVDSVMWLGGYGGPPAKSCQVGRTRFLRALVTSSRLELTLAYTPREHGNYPRLLRRAGSPARRIRRRHQALVPTPGPAVAPRRQHLVRGAR